SYSGATQYRMLAARPPHLVAQYARQSASDYHNEWVYRSGAFELGFNLMWTVKHNATNAHRLAHPDQVDARKGILDRAMAELDTWMEHMPLNPLPLVEDLSPWYSHWLDHPDDGPYWWQWNIAHRHHDVDTPVFHLGGWFDGFLRGTIENYRGMRKLARSERARTGQKMAIGPWVHGPDAVDSSSCGEVDFGPEAVLGVMQARLEWFDYWLKGIDTGVLESPNVRLFTMGANRWRDADAWPPPGVTYTPYYFHEGTSGSARSLNDGVLNQSQPEPAEHPDSYVYDPREPVRSLGGGHLGSPNGPHDQRPVEERVLTYTTAPLERDIEVTGPVKAVLHALSSARDTDWVVRLTDVHPDGISMQVCDGILRARYRHSRSEPQPLDGRIEVYEVDLWATSHLFKKGHRLRVAVASSSFPRWDRNMNTGGDNNREATGVTALNTIFHDSMRPSHILLPVMG
ncbi:MAG: CocE/NonD family hydrolase, partial [Dehalococcoidia bacterium]